MKDRILKNCSRCGETFYVSKFRPYDKVCQSCRTEESNQHKLEKDSFKLAELKERRFKQRSLPYVCEYCQKEFTEDYRVDLDQVRKHPPRFCSKKCARSFSNSKIIRNPLGSKKEENKEFLKQQRKEKYQFDEFSELGKFERSHLFIGKSKNLIKLGYNFNNPIEEEYYKFKDKLEWLYHIEEKSIKEIMKEFNIPSERSISIIFNRFGIKPRSLLEAAKISAEKAELNIIPSNSGGYQHTNGSIKIGDKVFYYRSSYELEMLKFLQNQNINFELNIQKIFYKDSKANKLRYGFPDFYLPDYQLFIEMKNTYNYDEQNLKDRYYTDIKNLKLSFIVAECEGQFRKGGFKFKNFKILNKFIEDSFKEEAEYIINLLQKW